MKSSILTLIVASAALAAPPLPPTPIVCPAASWYTHAEQGAKWHTTPLQPGAYPVQAEIPLDGPGFTAPLCTTGHRFHVPDGIYTVRITCDVESHDRVGLWPTGLHNDQGQTIASITFGGVAVVPGGHHRVTFTGTGYIDSYSLNTPGFGATVVAGLSSDADTWIQIDSVSVEVIRAY